MYMLERPSLSAKLSLSYLLIQCRRWLAGKTAWCMSVYANTNSAHPVYQKMSTEPLWDVQTSHKKKKKGVMHVYNAYLHTLNYIY